MKTHDFVANLQQYANKLPLSATNLVGGKIVEINGLALKVKGLNLAIGDLCQILISKKKPIYAQVMGFKEEMAILVATDDLQGVSLDCPITLASSTKAPLSRDLIGRIVNWQGMPLDGKSAVTSCDYLTRYNVINPLQRSPISQILDVGVRAINALCTVGVGQRLGLFAGSGVGKSMLLGMITKFSNADVVVVGLIGERGREVQEFIVQILGDEGMKKAIVVAVPSDSSALHKIHGTDYCTQIATYLRSCGLQVLLLIDSITRYAQALREVGLAAGELPIARGFVPSVFAKLPQLLEQAGNDHTQGGTITAIYTVLVEGDDLNEPLSDCVRGIVDGHIVLSRDLAHAGHFPAIDIGASVSRVMPQITDSKQQKNAQKLKQLWTTYQANQELVRLGAYNQGSDLILDEALSKLDLIRNFLQQNSNNCSDFAQSCSDLTQICTT